MSPFHHELHQWLSHYFLSPPWYILDSMISGLLLWASITHSGLLHIPLVVHSVISSNLLLCNYLFLCNCHFIVLTNFFACFFISTHLLISSCFSILAHFFISAHLLVSLFPLVLLFSLISLFPSISSQHRILMYKCLNLFSNFGLMSSKRDYISIQRTQGVTSIICLAYFGIHNKASKIVWHQWVQRIIIVEWIKLWCRQKLLSAPAKWRSSLMKDTWLQFDRKDNRTMELA